MQRFLTVAILLLFLPSATALVEHVDGIDAVGDLTMSGSMLGLAVGGEPGTFESIDVTASRAHGLEFRNEGTMADCPTSLCTDPVVPDPTSSGATRFPESGTYRDVDFSMVGMHDERVRLLVIPIGDATLEARTDVIGAGSMPLACITSRGVEESGAADLQSSCLGYNEERGTFNAVPVDEGLIVAEAGRATQLRINGNFALEFVGVQARLGDANMDTEDRSEQLAGDAYRYSLGFGRVVFHDAEAVIELTGAQEWTEWALPASELLALEATVSVRTAESAINPPQSSPLYTGDLLFTLNPTDDAMQVDVEERAPDGSPLNAAPAAPVWQTGWAWLVLASIVPLVGVAILVRRVRGPATMADIEAALGSGEYPKAIRMSKTMLRRDPDAPSVQLSHAIALTKAGRPREAVDAVRAFLDRGDPADGTLHYVMGLALHELGDEDAARSAMDDAVRRTPALAEDRHEGGAYT